MPPNIRSRAPPTSPATTDPAPEPLLEPLESPAPDFVVASGLDIFFELVMGVGLPVLVGMVAEAVDGVTVMLLLESVLVIGEGVRVISLVVFKMGFVTGKVSVFPMCLVEPEKAVVLVGSPGWRIVAGLVVAETCSLRTCTVGIKVFDMNVVGASVAVVSSTARGLEVVCLWGGGFRLV